MPYANKEDKAAQMRRYRLRQKPEKQKKVNQTAFLEWENNRLQNCLSKLLKEVNDK